MMILFQTAEEGINDFIIFVYKLIRLMRTIYIQWGLGPNIVELDAFVGLRPKEFRKLVISNIEIYFDEKIYKEVKKIEERRIEEARKLKEEIERFIEKVC